MAEQPAINFPEWTEYRKKNGLDPLGMQNTSVNLYQDLVPGIGNVTLRMRYYGLYAWLCKTYAQRDGDTNPLTWKRVIRRAEALYALVAYRQSTKTGIPSAGVAGIDWAKRVLDASKEDVIDFAADAEPGSETYYFAQAWGVFGLAYRSQLFEIKIFDDSTDHPLPIPSEIGDRLADAFADSIGSAASLFYDVLERGIVTKAELDTLSIAGASEISKQSPEQALYQSLLLMPPSADDAKAHARRMTMLLVLRTAALLGRTPRADEIRWTIFAGCDQAGKALEIDSGELEAHRHRWWVYHANDLCHIALETLLKFALDVLAEFPAGIPLSRLIPLISQRIVGAAGTVPSSWNALAVSIPLAANGYSSDPGTEWSLCEDIMRHAGRSDKHVCPPETAWTAIVLLATISKRVREEGRDIASVLGDPRFSNEGFRSLLTETGFLERHGDQPFEEFLGLLLEERVVRRHLWVALQKLRRNDYTFLIEADDGKLRLRDKDGPVFTNPRLVPAVNFLRDIHLLGDKGPTDYGIAAAGLS
ncbi:hypothetical protein ACVME5_006627 [Bradyrhizobium liaoningense]